MQASSKDGPDTCKRTAFTLTELLVVLGVTAILGTIAFNALQSTARAKVESVQCMNNHKQLIAAALLYADEFNGLWFPNEPIGTGNQIDWVNNNIDFSSANTDNTNILKLLYPQFSKFAPYIHGDPKLFHCPSDHSYVLGGPQGWVLRVRSVSANSAVGTVWVATGCLVANGPVNAQWLTGAYIGNSCQTVWSTYGKTSDFVLPGPGMTWVFTDESEDSINDAELVFQTANQGIGAGFVDKPANYHNRADNFSFADGHVEFHRWTGPTLGAPIYNWQGPARSGNYTVVNSADNSDLIWMQQRTSAHR